MRITFYIIIIIFLFSKNVIGQDYKCKIFKEKTDLENLVRNTKLESYYSRIAKDSLINNDIKLLYFRYLLGREGYKSAIYLEKDEENIKIYDISRNSQILLPKDQKELVVSLIVDTENGSFREACLNPGSEGSVSGCIISLNGNIKFEYEAPQYDYMW